MHNLRKQGKKTKTWGTSGCSSCGATFGREVCATKSSLAELFPDAFSEEDLHTRLRTSVADDVWQYEDAVKEKTDVEVKTYRRKRQKISAPRRRRLTQGT